MNNSVRITFIITSIVKVNISNGYMKNLHLRRVYLSTQRVVKTLLVTNQLGTNFKLTRQSSRASLHIC